ncbi:MAG: lipopolysaccharide biosynthesis protein [Ruthenibacterium sp.]
MQEQGLKRNFLWNTAGSLIYFAAQWLFTILVWRLITGNAAVGAGLLNTATAVTNVFLSLASYGMYSYQVSDMRQKYAQSAYVKSRAVTCAAAVALCGGYLLFNNSFGSSPYTLVQCVCILLMLLFRMIESVTDVYNAIDQKHGRLDLVGKTYAARGVLSLAAFAGVLSVTGSMTLTLLCVVLVNLAFYFIYTKRKVKPFYTKQPVKLHTVGLLLWECAPLALYSFLNTTTTSIPKILLGQISGGNALGVYGSVTAPVLLLQVGATYLYTPFITVFADRYAARDKHGFYQALRSVFAIIAALLPVGLLVSHFLGAWGLRTFVNASLESYQYLLSPMVVSAVLTALVLFFSMILTVMRCMRGLILANIGGILVSILVSAPMLRMFELQGATYAMILALIVQAVCLAGMIVYRARRYFSGGAQPPDSQTDGEEL